MITKISINGKEADISQPEEMYWKYVELISEVHEKRSAMLSPNERGALEMIPPKSKILDVCGGTGRWAKYLEDKGHSVKIVDLSPDMLKIAQNKGLNTEIQDARQLKEDDNSYDVVICLGNSIGGLLTVEDRIKAIQEMVRVSSQYVIIDYNNRWAYLRQWIPIYLRKLTRRYRAGIKIRPEIVTGHILGDIVWLDPEINDFLYHYVYSTGEIKSQMKSLGVNVKIYPSIWAQTPIIKGNKIGKK